MCACEDGAVCRRCREDVERYERDDDEPTREPEPQEVAEWHASS